MSRPTPDTLWGEGPDTKVISFLEALEANNVCMALVRGHLVHLWDHLLRFWDVLEASGRDPTEQGASTD